MSKVDTTWFDLSKYEPLRTLSLLDMYRQLEIRQVLYDHLFKNLKDLDLSVNSWVDDGIKHDVNCKMQNPALWIEKIKVNPLIPDYKYSHIDSSTVKPLLLIDAYLMTQEDRLSKVWKECNEKSDTFDLDEVADVFKSIDDLIYDAYGDEQDYDRCDFHLTVDLDATDKQLMNDFGHWLSKARKAYNRQSPTVSKKAKKLKQEFSENDMKIWINDRLIQYLDLKIISAFEGKELENAELGEILRSDMDGYTKGERARRTVKDKALHLISIENMRALAAQLRIPA